MAGNTLKAQLAEQQRRSIALLHMYPQQAKLHQVELRTPHEVCGCLLWCKVSGGYRCLYCMPPLELAEELSRVLESVVEKKWKNPYADASLATIPPPTPKQLQGGGNDEPGRR